MSERKMEEARLDDARADEVASLSSDVVSDVESLTIRTEADLSMASTMLQAIKSLIAEAKEIFEPPTKAAYAAHREIKAAWTKVESPLLEAERRVKSKVAAYHRAIEAEAERQRRAEAERLRKLEEERQLEAAIIADEAGNAKAVEEILAEEPKPTRAPLITAPPPPKTQGIQKQTSYEVEVTDIEAFVGWCLKTGSIATMIQPNLAALRKIVYAAKGEIQIDGVQIKKDFIIKSVKG